MFPSWPTEPYFFNFTTVAGAVAAKFTVPGTFSSLEVVVWDRSGNAGTNVLVSLGRAEAQSDGQAKSDIPTWPSVSPFEAELEPTENPTTPVRSVTVSNPVAGSTYYLGAYLTRAVRTLGQDIGVAVHLSPPPKVTSTHALHCTALH